MILILGGVTGGVGKSLADYLIHNGISVKPVGRDLCDLESEDSIRSFWNNTSWPTEPIHIVNCAGVSIPSAIERIVKKDMLKTFAVNVHSHHFMLKHARLFLKERGRSTYTAISSILQHYGQERNSVYCSSQSALRGFVRSAAKEFSRYGVRINSIELGHYDGGMIRDMDKRKLSEVIPLRRLACADDIWQTVKYFMACQYVT